MGAAGSLRRLRELSWGERRALARAWLLLPAIDAALRLVSFDRLRSWTATAAARRGEVRPPDAEERIRRCDRLVRAAAGHHLYTVRCLPRCLTLQWLLGRQGIASELQIGVRKEDGELRAHAWLESGGRPIGEPEDVDARFAPLHGGSSGR